MLKSILKSNKSMKLQSAMEYLITYGWAILILAIALSALFVLGVFNSSGATGQICKINQGFSCLNYYMNTTGALVLTLTQTGSNYINITSIGCSSDPNNQHLIQYTKLSQQPYIPYGTAYSVTLQCYTSTGKPSINIGTAFSGSLYINYVNDVTGFPGSAKGSFVIKPRSTTAIGLNSGSQGYIPVTLTNSQSIETVSGLQQMIYFNPSTYSQYLNKNLSNLEFSTGKNGTGTILNSWIESGASNTASNTVVWVNLGSKQMGLPSSYYVGVNVINSQNTATGTNFQQQIYFNPSSYSSYEASDLGNIRFYYGNTELYSWCESGCTSTSSNAIFWINTGSLNIGANSHAIINLTFEPTSTEYDGIFAGEAPQLSSTYGLYDNGAKIFNKYQNFAGTTLWSGISTIGEATITQNNGLEIGVVSADTGFSVMTNWQETAPFVYQSLITAQNSAGAINFQEGIIADSSSSTSIGLGGNYCESPNWYLARMDLPGNFYQLWRCSPGVEVGSSGATGSYPYTSMETFSQNTLGISISDNGYSISNSIENTLQSGYLGYDIVFSSSVNPNALFVQYSRVRTYPPNGVMPTFTLSSVEPEGSTQDTATIYMDFLTTSAPVVTGYTGYAPQLYCSSGCMQSSYGQYDNGASVFNLYDVSPTGSQWNTYGSGQSITTAAPIGDYFKNTNALVTTECGGGYITKSDLNSLGNDAIITFWTYGTGNGNALFFPSTSNGQSYGVGISTGTGYGTGIIPPSGGTLTTCDYGNPSSNHDLVNTWYQNQITFSGNSIKYYIQQSSSSTGIESFGSEIGSYEYNFNPSGNYISIGSLYPPSGNAYFSGFIGRYSPPNGVMPLVSFGSFTK